MASEMMRRRADGTFTYTTPEWDATWYWPVGTSVQVRTSRGLRDGIVVKENSVSVWVETEDERVLKNVSKAALVRMATEVRCPFCQGDDHGIDACPNIDPEQLNADRALRGLPPVEDK